MKNISDFQTFLIFFLVLVALLSLLPDTKINTIGDFFEKVFYPIGISISLAFGSKKLKKYLKSKKGKSP